VHQRHRRQTTDDRRTADSIKRT